MSLLNAPNHYKSWWCFPLSLEIPFNRCKPENSKRTPTSLPKMLPKQCLERKFIKKNTHAVITPPNTMVSCIITRKHNKWYFFDAQIGRSGTIAKFQTFDICGKSLTPHTSLVKQKGKEQHRLEQEQITQSSVFVHILWKHNFIAKH